MDYSSEVYEEFRNSIRDQRSQGCEWKDIHDSYGTPDELAIELKLLRRRGKFDGEFSMQDWHELVDYMESIDKKSAITKLTSHSGNAAKVPTRSGSQWVNYRKRLLKNGFSETSVDEIQRSVHAILQQLDSKTYIENDEDHNGRAVKGLVVGNVQSGKTANMAGLISMAADLGFNYFIIFSGIIDNLRKQTEDRMYDDLKIPGTNLSWNRIANPSSAERAPEHKWAKIDLSEGSKQRYFTVCLKNTVRMKQLKQWLYKSKSARAGLKVLIIDDEADQGSINTKVISNDENDENDRTQINQHMLDIVNGFQDKKLRAVNYISYTATPFANILNEVGDESLYPRDFIVQLTPSDDYIGPKQIFGLEQPETNSAVDIVLSIPDNDVLDIKDIQKGEIDEIPNSLKDALDWYFVASCALRFLNFKKPTSMLIHTSQKKVDHENIRKSVEKYLLQRAQDKYEYVKHLEEIYRRERLDFKRQSFLDGMPQYSNPNIVPDYPKWADVREEVQRVLDDKDNYVSTIKIDDNGELQYHHGFHMVVDNSNPQVRKDEQLRLIYPDKGKAEFTPMFIVIGGNTLSRSLTLSGLITSYFTRATSQADTLMQMGRWFGYRQKYEIFPRVWLTNIIKERFDFMSQMVDDLREEITEMSERGTFAPEDYRPKVNYSPSLQFLRVTANNKMQSAEEAEVDFTGFNKQTVLFKNDADTLSANIRLTSQFLNGLETFSDTNIEQGYLNWTDVPFEKICNYLEAFHFAEEDTAFNNISGLLKWYKDIMESDPDSFTDWNIVFSTTSNIPIANRDSAWNIKGYAPRAITRTAKMKSSEGLANIGALRAPTDLYADLNLSTSELNAQLRESERLAQQHVMRRIRYEYNYGKTPLLVIYRIDKDSKVKENSKRQNLEFSEDIIGMNLLIPSQLNPDSNGKKHVRKIRIKRPENLEDLDQDE